MLTRHSAVVVVKVMMIIAPGIIMTTKINKYKIETNRQTNKEASADLLLAAVVVVSMSLAMSLSHSEAQSWSTRHCVVD